MKLISEIGLNHCGDEKTAEKMLRIIIKSKSDGVTYQIKKNSWYKAMESSFVNKDLKFLERLREKTFIKSLLKKNTFNSLILKDEFYVRMIKLAKKSKKKIGFAVGDLDKIRFLSKAGADFFKILSEDFKNLKLIKAAINSRVKKVFISTGNKSLSEINRLMKQIKKNKIILIHTRFNHTISGNDLPMIERIRSKIKLPVAFSNHCGNPKIFENLRKYKPSSVFIYVKESNYKMYPDFKHAINLKKINYIRNILFKNE